MSTVNGGYTGYSHGAPSPHQQQQQQQQQQGSTAMTPYYAPSGSGNAPYGGQMNGNAYSSYNTGTNANGQQQQQQASVPSFPPNSQYGQQQQQQPPATASYSGYGAAPPASGVNAAVGFDPYASQPQEQQASASSFLPTATTMPPAAAGYSTGPFSQSAPPAYSHHNQQQQQQQYSQPPPASNPGFSSSNPQYAAAAAAPQPAPYAVLSNAAYPAQSANIVETQAVAVPFDPWGDGGASKSVAQAAPAPVATATATATVVPQDRPRPPSEITTKAPSDDMDRYSNYERQNGRYGHPPHHSTAVVPSNPQNGAYPSGYNGRPQNGALGRYDATGRYQDSDWKLHESAESKKQRRRHRRHGRMVAGAASGVIVGTLTLGPVGFVLGGPVGAAVARHASKQGEKRKDKKVQEELNNRRMNY